MSATTDPSETPTQPAMAAVRPPPTIEERVKTVEDRLSSVEGRLNDAEGRVEALSGRVDEGEKKHNALESKVDTVAADVAVVKEHTTKQTASLARIELALVPLAKQLGGLLNNPRVRFLGGVLLVLITGWLSSKGFRLP